MAYPQAVEQWRAPLANLFPASEIDKLLWVIQHESGGRPEAVGDSGASYGLFQSQSPRGSISDPTAQIQDAFRRYQQRGYKDWGENNSYQGKPFGALGNYPYPGGASVGGGGGGPAPNPYEPTAPGFDPAQFDALKAAILGAQNIQTPTSPLGAAPELANLYKSSFQLPQSEIATKAIGKIGQAQIDYQEKAKAKAEQLEEDMRDYAKYEKRQKADGGYDFFDPLGNQVDIATLSQRTGKRPAEILQYSENPKDRQFVRDYEGLFEYGQAFYDKAADPSDEKSRAIIDRYNESDERLNKLYKEFGAKPPDEYLGKLRELFHKTYKRYYVPSYQEPAPALRDTIFSRRAGPFTIPRYQSPNKPLFANPQNFTYDESDYVI